MITSVIDHIVTSAGFDCYPMVADEKTPLPFVVYNNVNALPSKTKASSFLATAFSLVVVAKTQVEIEPMVNALLAAFNRLVIDYDNTQVYSCLTTGQSIIGDMEEGGERLYFKTLDFKILHKTP
jgi:hypothetical protein